MEWAIAQPVGQWAIAEPVAQLVEATHHVCRQLWALTGDLSADHNQNADN
jgi:hypothetical protein